MKVDHQRRICFVLATVVLCSSAFAQGLKPPWQSHNGGLSLDGLVKEQACTELVPRFITVFELYKKGVGKAVTTSIVVYDPKLSAVAQYPLAKAVDFIYSLSKLQGKKLTLKVWTDGVMKMCVNTIGPEYNSTQWPMPFFDNSRKEIKYEHTAG